MNRAIAISRLTLDVHRNQIGMSLRAVIILALIAGMMIGMIVIWKLDWRSRATGLVLVLPTAAAVLFQWYRVVANIAAICSNTNLLQVPHLRRHVVLAFCSLWIGYALLLISFFANPYIFCVAAWLLLAAITQPSDRILRYSLLIIVLWIAFALTQVSFRFYNFGDNAGVLIMMFAVASGLLGLVGVTRVFPLLAVILWTVWLSTMSFSDYLFGMNFTQFLRLIYSLSSQFTTHVVVAIALGALTLYGLVGKKHRQPAIGLASFRERLNAIGGKKARALQVSVGYQTALRKVLEPAHRTRDTISLVPFSFPPRAHWTDALETSAVCFGLILVIPLMTMLFLKNLPPADLFNSSQTILAIFIFGIAGKVRLAEDETRRDRQLLSLSPGWPSEAALKSSIARAAFHRTLAVIACGEAMVIATSWLVTSSWDLLWPAMPTVLFCSIVLFGHGLHFDLAREDDQPTVWQVMKEYGPLAMLALVPIVFPMGKVYKQPILFPVVAGSFCVAYALWRWHRFMNSERVKTERA